MFDSIRSLLSENNFMPLGMCYLWQPTVTQRTEATPLMRVRVDVCDTEVGMTTAVHCPIPGSKSNCRS
jgi:hypothetical protein